MLEKAFFDLSPLKYPKLAPKFKKILKSAKKWKNDLTLKECNFFVF